MGAHQFEAIQFGANGHAQTPPTAQVAPLLESATALARRYTRFTTDDFGRAQQHLRAQHDSIRLSVNDPASFMGYRESVLPVGGIMLSMGCIGARDGYDLAFQSGDEYLFSIALRGRGWASTGETAVELTQEDVLVVSPSSTVLKHWEGPGEVLNVHIPVAAFDRITRRHAEQVIGPEARAPIAAVNWRRLRTFLRFIDMICRDIDDGPGVSPLLRGPVAASVEDALLSLLLADWPHPEADAARARSISPAIPYYIRRAEEFIGANAHRDITIQELADVAGVSPRSLQYGFRQYRDTTPMLFIKRMRYERARALLTAPGGPRRKISDVAAEIGYANVSQFSRDYRAMFGESPSKSLAYPRSLVS